MTPLSRCEVRDVAPGVWLWRAAHPDWSPPWDPLVSSFCVRAGDEIVIIDPLAPPADANDVWDRLDREPPTVVAILSPHHIRSVELFAQRYGARAFGPRLFFRHDIPESELEPIETGTVLPGGLQAVHDGRDRSETPLWIPQHRALVFADDVRGTPDGLRVWDVPWYEQRTLPAMRALLELSVELVLTSHGEPVHRGEDFEQALREPPSTNRDQATRAGLPHYLGGSPGTAAPGAPSAASEGVSDC
jgi:glyoxylase-like metal-dependent hydrolase (beta-lactamase superfamily II)